MSSCPISGDINLDHLVLLMSSRFLPHQVTTFSSVMIHIFWGDFLKGYQQPGPTNLHSPALAFTDDRYPNKSSRGGVIWRFSISIILPTLITWQFTTRKNFHHHPSFTYLFIYLSIWSPILFNKSKSDTIILL